MVPLLDVNAQNLPLEAELTAAFTRVLRSGQFIMGPEVEALERECAAMTGAAHGIGVSSGTDAILLALMALGIGPGDEVLVPTFTFFATAGCVSRTGATPVFVDADPETFNIDVAKAADKITPRTRAIIPVHLFGQCADMDAVMALAAEHSLFVIEDGAQAIGATWKGRGAGSIGHFGTFSFFPSKNLGGFGDGGLLVTSDDALADRARLLRTHGSRPKYYHRLVGGNFRLDPLQAALLRVKLPHYPEYTRKRQANAAFYTEKLSEFASGPHPALILPKSIPENKHIWNQFTLRVPGPGRRDALKAHLAKAGIGCEIYYPVTMDQQECFAHTPENSRSHCDTAHQLAAEVISIPIFPELTSQQLEEVVSALRGFVD